MPHLKKGLQREDASVADKYRAAYALASIYENSGRYEEGLSLLKQAGSFKRISVNYESANMRTFVDAVKAFFTQEKIQSLQGAGLRTQQPVFIVGMPRSGTTLVEQMLTMSPDVYGAGELNHLQRVLGAQKSDSQFKEFSAWGQAVSAEKLTSWAQEYLSLLQAENNHEQVRFISDKMPSNALFTCAWIFWFRCARRCLPFSVNAVMVTSWP